MKTVEIYPKIVVYKNMFKNIQETYSVIKESHKTDGQNFFNNWSQWSRFGKYINPITNNFPEGYGINDFEPYSNIDKALAVTDLQKKQKEIVLELLDIFYLVTKDYALNNGINIDQNEEVLIYDGVYQKMWKPSAPAICKYDIEKNSDPMAMSYHSDFRREKAEQPGYKFVITALAYFNDNYEGGEIDFVIGKQLIKYKPEAGDFLVFPSGHPDFLTDGDNVYLHGVLPTQKENKYFARMFWEKYSDASENWYQKEKEHGKENWLAMQPEIEKEFLDKHKQRSYIEDGVRIS